MTRQKSKIKMVDEFKLSDKVDGEKMIVEAGKKPAKQLDLRSQFKALDSKEQEAIINFFNLHNAAIWIYSSLSTPAVEYVNLSIKLSQEKVKEEV